MTAINIFAPAWMAEALCASVDPALWFPERGESGRPAKKVCAECPVAAACLSWALEHQINSGIFGGLSYRERLQVAA